MVIIETQTYCDKLRSIHTKNVAFHFLFTEALYETQCGTLLHIKKSDTML